MKFIPKSKKYNKVFKLRFKKLTKITNKTIELKYGKFGIKAIECGLMTVKHFTTLQLIIRRGLKRKGKFWFRKLPYTFTTKKPQEVRMGKGKGNHAEWVCPINIGQIIVEFSFVNFNFFNILHLLKKCIKRLPVKAILVSKTRNLLKKNLICNFNLLTNQIN